MPARCRELHLSSSSSINKSPAIPGENTFNCLVTGFLALNMQLPWGSDWNMSLIASAPEYSRLRVRLERLWELTGRQ